MSAGANWTLNLRFYQYVNGAMTATPLPAGVMPTLRIMNSDGSQFFAPTGAINTQAIWQGLVMESAKTYVVQLTADPANWSFVRWAEIEYGRSRTLWAGTTGIITLNLYYQQATGQVGAPAAQTDGTIVISPTSGPAPLTVTSTLTPTAGLAPFTYQHLWGDGTASTSPTATKTFANPGTYSYSGYIRDINSVTKTLVQTITVLTPSATNPPPTTTAPAPQAGVPARIAFSLGAGPYASNQPIAVTVNVFDGNAVPVPGFQANLEVQTTSTTRIPIGNTGTNGVLTYQWTPGQAGTVVLRIRGEQYSNLVSPDQTITVGAATAAPPPAQAVAIGPLTVNAYTIGTNAVTAAPVSVSINGIAQNQTTPFTIQVANNATYAVNMGAPAGLAFDHWGTDVTNTVNPRTGTFYATAAGVTFTAFYRVGDATTTTPTTTTPPVTTTTPTQTATQFNQFWSNLANFPLTTLGTLITQGYAAADTKIGQSGVTDLLTAGMNALKPLFDGLAAQVANIMRGCGICNPNNALSDALSVALPAMGVGFGIYAASTATDLLHPLKGTGIVPAAIDIVKALGTGMISQTMVGSFAQHYIDRPLGMYFNQQFRPFRPGGGMADQMLFEGNITRNEWEQLYRWQGWTDQHITAWYDTMFIEPPARMLISMFEDEQVDPAWIGQKLAESGYSAADLNVIVAFARRKAQDRSKVSGITTVTTRFKEGFITMADMAQELRGLGAKDPEITNISNRAVLEKDTDVKKDVVAAIQSAFRKQLISVTQLRAALASVIKDGVKLDNVVFAERARAGDVTVLPSTTGPISAPPAPRPLVVSSSPALVSPGGTVRWVSDGSPANEVLTVRLDSARVGSGAADSGGHGTGTFVLPVNTTPGRHAVVVVGGDPALAGQSPIDVAAAAQAAGVVNPTAAAPGTQLTWSVSNYSPGEALNILLDTVRLATGAAAGDGTGSGTVLLPTTVAAGTHTITLQGATHTITVPITVNVTVQTTTLRPCGLYKPVFGTLWNATLVGNAQAIVDAKRAHPRVPFAVTVNPNGGPTATPVAAVTNFLNNAVAAGIERRLGYIPTHYMDPNRAPANPVTYWVQQCKNMVDQYKIQYPQVNGIFWDEASPNAATQAYYTDIETYARAAGYTWNMANPGSPGSTWQVNLFANTAIWENNRFPNYANAGDWPGYAGIPAAKLTGMVHSLAAYDQPQILAMKARMGYIFVTDKGQPDPYGQASAYLDQMLADLDS